MWFKVFLEDGKTHDSNHQVRSGDKLDKLPDPPQQIHIHHIRSWSILSGHKRRFPEHRISPSLSNCIRFSTGTLVNMVNITVSFFCLKSTVLGGQKMSKLSHLPNNAVSELQPQTL
jgi:hypothetical protein